MIFDGTSITETQIVVGADKPDYQLLNLGKLMLREDTITSPTPFDAPFRHISGVDCKLIYGDVWQQIGTVGLPGTTGGRLGPPPGSIVGYQPPRLTTNVRGSETHSVIGDLDTTINGNVRFTVQNFGQPAGLGDPPNLGSYTETFHGHVNRTFFQKVTETYHDDKHVNQKENCHLEHKKCDIENVGLAIGITAIIIDVNNYAHIEVGNLHVEGRTMAVAGKIVSLEKELLDLNESLFKDEKKAVEQNLHGVRKEVGALEHKTTLTSNALLYIGMVCPAPAPPAPPMPPLPPMG